MKILISIILVSLSLSCSLLQKEDLQPNDTEKIDSTWAKNFIDGKSFFVSLGNSPDSIKNGLELFLKPISFKNKTYNITFIYHKQPFIDYFNERKKRDSTLDVFGVAIGIATRYSTGDTNEKSLITGSIEIINKTHPNPQVKAIVISNMNDVFTYEDIKPTINPIFQNEFKKEYLFSATQDLIIYFTRGEKQYFDGQKLIFDPIGKIK